ncbi:hypothetical protein D9615_009451 [Tricholomella constricta]|uniref:Uncharacterized protein n=1 Tax=Tricholomella constricta TaxID=117010 RepID=A0A8H5GYM6_9AGAR|nr:hypothetical protein D9615_009451 [Tricholomella constricta]
MDPTSSFAEGFANLSVGDLPVNPPHEPIVQDAAPLLARVSNERDRFIDDDHKPLDVEIMESFSLYRDLNKEPHLPGLLSNITVGDKRLVTLSPSEARDLLKREPSINPLLHQAWEEGSFKEVRKLEILWPVVQESLSGCSKKAKYAQRECATDPLLYGRNSLEQALQSAWRGDYLGDHHRLLLSNIDAILPTEDPYSNQITIVQSSGTGKSRMVHEQAKLVFTIPFNLRGEDSTKSLAFPMPDAAVRDWLVSIAKSDDLKGNCLKFFASVFTQVNDELEKFWEELSKKSAEDLAKWWSSHFEGIREGLYKAAITDAKQPSKNLPEIQKRHEDLLAEHRKEGEGYEDPVIETAAESARLALQQLLSKLRVPDESKSIKLIIYFDEAHPLTKVVIQNDDGKTLYDFLCSYLNEFLSLPVVFIFLSTNSSLAYFAAPKALARSARIRGGAATTHAPITETPFDCCGDLVVKPGELLIKDISTIPFMAKFGRPLFWTMLRGAGRNKPAFHREVLGLARAKLVSDANIDSSVDILLASKLAVLDLQLSLDFEPRREKVQIQEAGLVESHMRFAYSIPGHREYLRSGYPSEPLLAEAAAQQLWNWRMKRPFVVVETLTDVLDDGLLDRGELGELTGRQLLLDAYHRAVEEEQPKQTRPIFSAGCRLITFIEKLFSEKYAKMVLDSTPDNMKGVSFREAFKDALVCFTHFGKMADNTGVTSSAAWAAFIRHMAIMCRNGQRTVDCIIPVLLQNTVLCEHVMTGVLVQFKRQIQRGTIAKYSIDQAKIEFFPEIESCKHGSKIPTSYRPYIGLVMELGIQGKVSEEAKTAIKFRPDRSSSSSSSSSKKSGGPSRTPSPSRMVIPQRGQRHHPQEGHPRYHIFAYGCSPTVYRGIDAAHKDKYAQLLKSRDFLGEHPRQNSQTLKAVQRMKPFWNGGEDCYHWVEHNDILHGPAPPRREEVLVGKQMY